MGTNTETNQNTKPNRRRPGGIRFHEGYALLWLPGHHRAGKSGYVRRCIMVAEAKLGRRLAPGEVVHHINQKRDDDRPENIHVFASQGEHIAHHNRSIKRARKLTEDDVREIKRMLREPPPASQLGKKGTPGRPVNPNNMLAAAKRFGVSHPTIRGIKAGLYWKHVD